MIEKIKKIRPNATSVSYVECVLKYMRDLIENKKIIDLLDSKEYLISFENGI